MDNTKKTIKKSSISKKLIISTGMLLLSACVGGGSSGSSDIPNPKVTAELPIVDVTGKVTTSNAESIAAGAYRLATFMDKMMQTGFIVLTSSNNPTFENAFKNKNTAINQQVPCGTSGSATMSGNIGTFTSPGKLTVTYEDCLTEDDWYLDGIADINILEIYSPKGRINEAKAVFKNLTLRYPGMSGEIEEDFEVVGDIRAFYEIMTFDSQGEPIGEPREIRQAISNELSIESKSSNENYFGTQLRTQYENRQQLLPGQRKGFFNTSASGIYSYNGDLLDTQDKNAVFIKGASQFDQIYVYSDPIKKPLGFNPLLISILDDDDAMVDYYIRIPSNELGRERTGTNPLTVTLNNSDTETVGTGWINPFSFPNVIDKDYTPFSIEVSLTHDNQPAKFVDPDIIFGDIKIDHFFNFRVYITGNYTVTYTITEAGSSPINISFTLKAEGVDLISP